MMLSHPTIPEARRVALGSIAGNRAGGVDHFNQSAAHVGPGPGIFEAVSDSDLGMAQGRGQGPRTLCVFRQGPSADDLEPFGPGEARLAASILRDVIAIST
jgi:hypothetical protein